MKKVIIIVIKVIIILIPIFFVAHLGIDKYAETRNKNQYWSSIIDESLKITDADYLEIKSLKKLTKTDNEYKEEVDYLTKLSYDIIKSSYDNNGVIPDIYLEYFSNKTLYEQLNPRSHLLNNNVDYNEEYEMNILDVIYNNNKAIVIYELKFEIIDNKTGNASAGEHITIPFPARLYFEKQNDVWVVVDYYFHP